MTEIVDVFVDILKQYGIWGLILLTFLDSFISPVPPETLLIPLCLATPETALLLAGVTTITSVLGAIIGHVLGTKGGRPLLYKFFSSSKVDKAEKFIQSYGVTAVLAASFTPIPYKLVTISSGVLGLSLKKLLLWSTLGRGARFFLEAAIIMAFGELAKNFLKSPAFSILTLSAAIIAIIIYFVYLKFFSKNKRKT